MKKYLFNIIFFISLLGLTGCSTDLYDYDELSDRMDAFDKRLAELEDWCKETNTNINSLKTLIESLLVHDMITSVTPVMNENQVAGYTITFLNADPITIYNGLDGKDGADGTDGADGEDGKDGVDGKDGYTPLIGVKQDTDNVYYWTLDGSWLKDAQGNQIRVQGEKGADGTDGEDGTNGLNGVTPKLEIREDGFWYVSYDDGQNWTSLGQAVGKDGQDGEDGEDGKDGTCYFSEIDYKTSNDYVIFKFSDNSELKIPTWSAFETYKNQTNTNVSSLQTLVDALQKEDYVTGVEPYLENGAEVGYTIKFSKSGPIVIYHGKDGQDGTDGTNGTDGANGTDGKDGVTPVMGVKKDTDGVYYWTVNGEWLTDADGNKVRAQGVDGAQGQDGITPKVKIGDDGYWYVSYDGGTEWEKVGDKPASSDNGVFKEIKVEAGQIIFVLNDGTQLMVPTYQKVKITFGAENKDKLSGIAANEVIYIPYTLEHATSSTLVSASSDGNYAVVVQPADQNSGQIVVTAPEEYVDGFVNIHIDNGNGFSSIHVINFYHQQMIFSKGQEYMVAAEGQTIEVPVKVNFDYSVDIPSSAQPWIELADSRAVEFRDEILTFTFPANPNKAGRSASVGIIPSNALEPLYYITFNQASAFFTIDKTRLAVKGEGETLTVNITSSLGLNIQNMPNWITPTLTQNGTAYTLQLTVAANDTESYRTGSIKLYEDPTNGSTLLGEIEVIQIAQTDDDKKAMVIEVSANPANDYTVTLPLVKYYNYEKYAYEEFSCVVDWGDGTKDYVTTEYPTHTYQLSEAQNYDVKISGIVSSLSSSELSDLQRQAIIAVKQWGQTNLKSMANAFLGCLALQSVVSDNTMAFIGVKDFSACFAGCSNLTSEGLSSEVFAYAVEATDFSYVFSGCSSLTMVPEDLFKECRKVTNFSCAFSQSGITQIPENLFIMCTDVSIFDQTFYECTFLESIPEKLFINNSKVVTFNGTFKGTSIQKIPANLFANCVEVLSFGDGYWSSGTFSDCKKLTEIPNELFKKNVKVNSFSHTFYSCSKLIKVPVDLFDNNIKVVKFTNVFAGCGQLEGESPYTIIDGVVYHLYERKKNMKQFITPTSYNGAFNGCSKLSDYADIPSDWK